MDDITFWKLIREHVTPDEIAGGEYHCLIDALVRLDSSELAAFRTNLAENVARILPDADEFERELLTDTPDVAETLRSHVTAGPKGGPKVPLFDFLKSFDNR